MGFGDALAEVTSTVGEVLQQWFAATSDTDDGYVVGWGTLALLNAGLAQAKGRSGAGWFFLSLLLGPIATLVLVLFRPLEVPCRCSPSAPPAAADAELVPVSTSADSDRADPSPAR